MKKKKTESVKRYIKSILLWDEPNGIISLFIPKLKEGSDGKNMHSMRKRMNCFEEGKKGSEFKFKIIGIRIKA